MSDFIARRPLTCIYSLQIVSSLAIAALYILPVKVADFGLQTQPDCSVVVCTADGSQLLK